MPSVSASMRAAAVLALFAVGGCQATFSEPRSPAGASHDRWQSFYLFGAFGAPELDVRDVCRSGKVRQIRMRSNALTLLLSLSLVYTPRIVSVTCAR